MRASNVALLLSCIAVHCADTPAWTPLSEVGRDNAVDFIAGIEANIGRRVTREEIQRDFRSKVDEYHELMTSTDVTKFVTAVRSFVKGVGPPLGSHEDRHDQPLHNVLERACDILGMDRDPEQDLHPHLLAKQILRQGKEFWKAVADHHSRRPKDEL